MTKISDIVNIADMEFEIERGMLNRRYHPLDADLAIVGYSDAAQWANEWTPTQRALRGVIYRVSTGQVLARPFAKFFNYGQEPGIQYDLDAPIYGAWDKADGSLGILYYVDDEESPAYGLNVATRGSFASEQAEWATAYMRRKWESLYDWATEMIHAGYTPLVEIIYPDNRIVLDYGYTRELRLLGLVNMHFGDFEAPPRFKEFVTDGDKVAQELGVYTLREVLEQPDRPNAEGWVVWIDEFTAVKIKQQDYLELHKIVTNLSEKAVLEALISRKWVEFVQKLPDEFYEWANRVGAAYLEEYDRIEAEVKRFFELRPRLGSGASRKDQADWINSQVPQDLRAGVFILLNYKDLEPWVWKKIKQDGKKTDPEAPISSTEEQS